MAVLLPNEEVSQAQMRGYRIFVWSQDHENPPHVHVRKGKSYSTWTLRPLKLVDRGEFSSSDIRLQRKLLRDFYDPIVRSFDAHWKAQKTRLSP